MLCGRNLQQAGNPLEFHKRYAALNICALCKALLTLNSPFIRIDDKKISKRTNVMIF